MKIGQKLFLSYLMVIALVVAVLSIALSLVAPFNFTRYMQMSMQHNEGEMNRMRSGGMMPYLDDEIEGYFSRSINNALIPAGLAALGGASLASWLISRRVVKPIKEVAQASHRIADGHYDERLINYKSNDELGELTRSFNQMASTLEATEQLRRQLLADVSHELKTPLASIKGYMEGLQDGVIEPTPGTFDLVHREATRLQHLVEDLQELSRAESSQLGIDILSIQAAVLVTAAVDFLRPQYQDQGVTLSVDLPEHPIMVQADFDRIRQVLLNILGNALMYTPPGGTVSIEVEQQNDRAYFRIHDTGVGLEAADLKRVFQRFYRVDRSRARASGGSGIGLTIAHHIVDEHGGHIWAESEGLGHGSTFVFTLPITSEKT